jgi:uncharacterized membrane protein YoaK (UPF0700 family)
MGLQSAAVQRLGISGVATVFVTGTFTTATLRFVDGMKTAAPQKQASATLPALSWASYFLGAFVGGFENVWHTPIPIILPAILIGGVGLAYRRSA